MTYAANIIINNNIIDQGIYSDGDDFTETFKYDHCLWTYGSSLIEGNSFLNPNTSADMLNITDGSCIVRNNKFVRNNTSINSYIRHHYDIENYIGVHEITNNIFDNSTIDGIEEQLVRGLIPDTVYAKNRNQIGYLYIPLFDNELYVNGGSSYIHYYSKDINTVEPSIEFYSPRKLDEQRRLTTSFIGNVLNSDKLQFMKSFHLGHLLERGMRILDVSIGAYVSIGTLDSGTCEFGARVYAHDVSTSSGNMIASVFNSDTVEFTMDRSRILSDFDKLTIKTQTIYNISGSEGGGGLPGDFHGFVRPDYFRIGNGYHQELVFYINFPFTDNLWGVELTPLLIKYTW